MALSRATTISFDGMIWGAFQRFCYRKGVENSREGIRALVRELPEFKESEEAMICRQQAKAMEEGANNGGD